jgi:HEAT repeat protein
MQHPNPQAMRALIDLTNNSSFAIRSAARMISGALSRVGRHEHPAVAEAIDASLIAIYQKTHDATERVELLGALGNSAGASVVPVVEEALHDTSNPVRSAAARALRLAPGSDVDQVLATVISSDTSGPVRADAVFATHFRHPLTALLADALLRAASSDTSRFVRSDAIAVLSQNPTASVRIPDTLEQIAQHDADSGIRKQAGDALESLTAIASSHP